MPKNLKGGNDMLSSHGATDGDERVEVAFLGLASSVMHSVEPSCRISTPVSWKSRNVCAISRSEKFRDCPFELHRLAVSSGQSR